MQKSGTPKRPRTVPQGARWVAPLWQYGSVDAKGAALGLWCGWKKNGVLAYVAVMRDDAVEGASIEFHPDGALCRRATYAKGEIVGSEEFFASLKKSDEPFPADKPVARVLVDHSRGGTRRYFLADGAESNEQGTPLTALICDAPFLVRDTEVFAKKSLPLYVKHRIKVAPSAAAKAKCTSEPGLTRELAALWGMKVRGTLKPALALLERGRLPKTLGALKFESVASLSAQAAGATAETIIVRGQRTVGALPTVSLLAGLVPFGQDAGGNVFALALHDDVESSVVSWTRAERDIVMESDDFAAFVMFHAASEAQSAGMLSPRARAHLAKVFAGHLRATKLGDVSGAAPETWMAAPFDARESKAEARQRRSAWLAAFLGGEPIDVVVETFQREEAGPLDRALVARLGRPQDLTPPDMIYALFRSVITGDPRVLALTDVAAKSKSSLVVSSAALVRALGSGRNRLGNVKDVATLSRALTHALFR